MALCKRQCVYVGYVHLCSVTVHPAAAIPAAPAAPCTHPLQRECTEGKTQRDKQGKNKHQRNVRTELRGCAVFTYTWDTRSSVLLNGRGGLALTRASERGDRPTSRARSAKSSGSLPGCSVGKPVGVRAEERSACIWSLSQVHKVR